MRHRPSRPCRAGRPGPRSSQSRSCSRTACTPAAEVDALRAAPARRAARRAPAASCGASRARGGRSRAPPGWMRSSSGRTSSRISPRTVAGSTSRCASRGRARGSTPRSPRARRRAAGGRRRPRAAALIPFVAPARGEPEEDRLDLVRERVPRRAQRVGAERVAHVAQTRLRRAARGCLHDLGAEPLGAPAPRPRRTPRRAGRGRRAAPRRDSRARAARGRGRSSRRRPRRGRARRRPGAISSCARMCRSTRSSSSSALTTSRRCRATRVAHLAGRPAEHPEGRGEP